MQEKLEYEQRCSGLEAQLRDAQARAEEAVLRFEQEVMKHDEEKTLLQLSLESEQQNSKDLEEVCSLLRIRLIDQFFHHLIAGCFSFAGRNKHDAILL